MKKTVYERSSVSFSNLEKAGRNFLRDSLSSSSCSSPRRPLIIALKLSLNAFSERKPLIFSKSSTKFSKFMRELNKLRLKVWMFLRFAPQVLKIAANKFSSSRLSEKFNFSAFKNFNFVQLTAGCGIYSIHSKRAH